MCVYIYVYIYIYIYDFHSVKVVETPALVPGNVQGTLGTWFSSGIRELHNILYDKTYYYYYHYYCYYYL